MASRVDDRRPSPEELLRRITADERRERRGRLKVFLGYASRVGKSQRMFDEGRRRRLRGQDVVVGAIQNDCSPEIQQIVSKLEVIPTIPAKYGDRAYEVIDLAAIFRRRPQVCVVDALANDNPPGSRNPSRWQDVNELLERGISVITAVNLQHIEEQKDAVARITGKRAVYGVPEAFLREADEIEVVDAPPEVLVNRGETDGAPQSRHLAELRELALLLAADVVERQLQGYLDSHGVAMRWGVQERILVCLTPQSNAARMLRSGWRNAQRFHGALLAIYVVQRGLTDLDREKLESHLALAREMGAEVQCLEGADFVRAILDFANQHHITQLFIGHTRAGRRLFFRSAVDRLIDAAEDFDIRLFPQEEA
jgi:two-component system, OmpR family, sensor histidine kinase KdpD